MDDVHEVRVRNGVITLHRANGLQSPGTSGSVTLRGLFGASGTEPLVLLDGLVLRSLPQTGTSSSAGRAGEGRETTSVTSVGQAGSVYTVSTTVQSDDPEIAPMPQRRMYVQQGSDYVLTEVQTDVVSQTPGMSVSGRSTVRFEQATYFRNDQKDAARRGGTAPSPWGGSGGGGTGGGGGTVSTNEVNPPCQIDPATGGCVEQPAGPVTGTQTTCDNVAQAAGGANLVYVHGILADGSAWGDPADGGAGVAGPLRCALRISAEARPSLSGSRPREHDKGRGPHDEQASQLSETLTGLSRTQNILIGHSQGGLISRRVAQARWSQNAGSPVRAVVTTGTPHLGAPIAYTLAPGGGLNSMISKLSSRAGRRLGGGSVASSLTTMRDGFLSFSTFSSPAMQNLRPDSRAIQDVNVPESFPRYGITNEIPRRWALARVGGDFFANNGESVVSSVKKVYNVAVTGSVIGFFFGVLPGAAFATVAVVMNATDLLWNRLTVGSQQGDGVVPLASQRYPGATAIYVTPQADVVSHTAQIDTPQSARSIRRVLEINVGVPVR